MNTKKTDKNKHRFDEFKIILMWKIFFFWIWCKNLLIWKTPDLPTGYHTIDCLIKFCFEVFSALKSAKKEFHDVRILIKNLRFNPVF